MYHGFTPVNWIDPILLLVLFLFGLRGYFKGLFRETFTLGGLIVGFMIAVRYDEVVAARLDSYWDASPLVLKGAAFVAIFFVVYFIFALIGWLLHWSAKVLFLQTLNRLGGIAVGLGKGAAATALIVLFVSSSAWIPRSTRERVEGSYLGPPLSQLAIKLIRVGKEKLLPPEGERALTKPGLCCS
ncbi:MAG TPA: CvpA family protein [Candidatus Binatia bacterium]|nr:CvpA family protein [Candidatus Binatia bacterium]